MPQWYVNEMEESNKRRHQDRLATAYNQPTTEPEFVEFTIRIDVDDDSSHDVTMGAYGPEAKTSVFVPMVELKQFIEEEGHPPTAESLTRLIDEMQEFFSDKHGGCPEDVVQGHIWDTALGLILDWELDDDNEMS